MSTLVTEVAKPAKDAASEVVRSADLMHYSAEEGVRLLAEGKLLTSDAFPGNERNKLCMVSKIALGVRAQPVVPCPHSCVVEATPRRSQREGTVRELGVALAGGAVHSAV